MAAVTYALINQPCAASQAGPGIEGLWETFDDQGAPTGFVRITQHDGTYAGVVERGLPGEAPRYCTACSGPLHGRALIGLEILGGLRAEGDHFGGGHILDPFSGNDYHARLTLSPDGATLNVRGYIGIPLLGRTQTWHRAG